MSAQQNIESLIEHHWSIQFGDPKPALVGQLADRFLLSVAGYVNYSQQRPEWFNGKIFYARAFLLLQFAGKRNPDCFARAGQSFAAGRFYLDDDLLDQQVIIALTDQRARQGLSARITAKDLRPYRLKWVPFGRILASDNIKRSDRMAEREGVEPVKDFQKVWWIVGVHVSFIHGSYMEESDRSASSEIGPTRSWLLEGGKARLGRLENWMVNLSQSKMLAEMVVAGAWSDGIGLNRPATVAIEALDLKEILGYGDGDDNEFLHFRQEVWPFFKHQLVRKAISLMQADDRLGTFIATPWIPGVFDYTEDSEASSFAYMASTLIRDLREEIGSSEAIIKAAEQRHRRVYRSVVNPPPYEPVGQAQSASHEISETSTMLRDAQQPLVHLLLDFIRRSPLIQFRPPTDTAIGLSNEPRAWARSVEDKPVEIDEEDSKASTYDAPHDAIMEDQNGHDMMEVDPSTDVVVTLDYQPENAPTGMGDGPFLPKETLNQWSTMIVADVTPLDPSGNVHVNRLYHSILHTMNNTSNGQEGRYRAVHLEWRRAQRGESGPGLLRAVHSFGEIGFSDNIWSIASLNAIHPSYLAGTCPDGTTHWDMVKNTVAMTLTIATFTKKPYLYGPVIDLLFDHLTSKIWSDLTSNGATHANKMQTNVLLSVIKDLANGALIAVLVGGRTYKAKDGTPADWVRGLIQPYGQDLECDACHVPLYNPPMLDTKREIRLFVVNHAVTVCTSIDYLRSVGRFEAYDCLRRLMDSEFHPSFTPAFCYFSAILHHACRKDW
ncbi:hypothetical protein P7C73_g5980, partial [Tremellales sp. Uapishka_1]